MDVAPGPEPACGAAGTYCLEGDPYARDTGRCQLHAGHEEPHDWAQHESEIRDEGYQVGREDALRQIETALCRQSTAAAETYARRKALGIADQAKEWAIRSRTWKEALRVVEAVPIVRGNGANP